MFATIQEKITRFLRWSERYTKIDMVYFASGGSLSLLGQGLNIIASLALAVAVSHFISKDSYGVYKYIVSIITILSLFSLNSIGSAVFQSAAEGLDGALIKGFWENIRWSVVIFVGTLGLSLYYFSAHNDTLAVGVLIGGMLSPFLASASLFGSFLGGKKDFYRLTVYGILDNVIPVLIFIGVVIITGNPIVLVSAYFLTNTIAGLYFYRRTILVYRANMHKHDAGMLGYSKHLSFMGILTGIASNIDQIILFHYVGASQLAVYNFATAIPDQMKGPIRTIDSMVQARFVNHSAVEIKRSMRNKIFLYVASGTAVTLAYIAIAPFIFHLLFQNYAEAIWYSQIYALWIIPVCLDPLSSYICSRRLIAEQYIANVVYTIFQIAALFIGVIFWGLLGVVIARILTRVAVSATNFVLYRRAIEREISASV